MRVLSTELLRLPETVDSNKIQSTYENGVLIISLPEAEEK
ncbi:MAG: Hsp20/alpha crystallin family protein [Chloroflexota bacterium]